MQRLAVFAAVLAALAGAAHASAATYHVSADGSDAASGASTAPWRTVGKVNSTPLEPGDRVVFRGGDTFTDSTLMPRGSGVAGSPITFASYGGGRATIANASGAVWFAGKRHLVFENLVLTTNGAKKNVFAGSASAGSTDIVLRDSVVENTAGVGIIAPSDADARWAILDNTIRHIGDSGMILLSPGTRVEGNTITDTGWNTAITYGKHGIYAKARDLTIARNDISDAPQGQAISIRFHGARVYENLIHDTPYALAFFDYDTASAPKGTSYVYDNRFWNISGYAFYYSGQSDPNGRPPGVDFVIASNTFVLTGTEAVNVSESGSANVTLANNVFTGSYGSALRRAATTSAHHNIWHGARSNVPTGSGNVTTNPQLAAAPILAPLSGSPVIDAGSTTVTSLTYEPSCVDRPLAYCAAAPELGAVEVLSAAPLAPPTGFAATARTGTSVSLAWTPSTDARVVSYRVTRNGSLAATTTASVATVGGLSCGTSHDFAVVAVDSAGAVSAAATVRASTAACPDEPTTSVVDTTEPYVVFSAPKQGQTVPLSFTATVTATDGGGVDHVTFFLGSKAVCTDAAAPYTCKYSIQKGTQRLQARATDRAGNRGWVSITVTGSKSMRSLASGAAKLAAAKATAARAAKVKAAKLKAAKLRAAKLRAAKLKAAKLRAAKLRAAKLRAAKLRAAKAKAAQAKRRARTTRR